MRARSVIGIVLAVVIIAALVQWFRPLPPVSIQPARPTAAFPGTPPNLPWPAGIQAAIDVPNVGPLGTRGPTAAAPIGSVAKVMTALLVLKKHPLGLYANGPAVAITAADVAAYRADLAGNQSVMPVSAGEKLSERILLEGLLVPSANNVANILATWMSGSTTAFVSQMNAQAKSLGLSNTHYADVSGLSPNTVSTASDQVKLAEIAMKIPTFAQIVAMPQMNVPGFGLVYNYNSLVGHDGIIGVKTGSTTAGGASFIWAGQRTVGSQTLTIFGGLLGESPTTSTTSQLTLALNAGRALLDAAGKAVRSATVVRTGQTVGELSAPWAPSVPVVAVKPVMALGWGGLPIRMTLKTTLPKKASSGVAAHTRIGTLTVTVGHQTFAVPVETSGALPAPSASWRMKRL